MKTSGGLMMGAWSKAPEAMPLASMGRAVGAGRMGSGAQALSPTQG
ncbi:MAG: hypothetical protein HOP18_03880 [Deltaproteobacteria bacterium]|nr:hypothetical protein [Deltaproteobacteria bacterium]